MALPPAAAPVLAILAALGFEGASYWAGFVGAALIGASQVVANRDLRPPVAGVTFTDMLPVVGLPSLMHGCIAAFAAMGGGRLVHWCWTVLTASAENLSVVAINF